MRAILRLVAVFIFFSSPLLAKSGYLLVSDSSGKMIVCKNGQQATLRLPGFKGGSYGSGYMINSSRYLLAYENKRLAVIDLSTGKIRMFSKPAKGYLKRYIKKEKKFVYITHGYYRAALTYRDENGRNRRIWSYNRWLANKFYFLEDGRHLFCHTAGMGKKESNYYIDLVLGHKQTLYYVKKLGARPRSLVIRRAFFKPRFANNGKQIVFLVPGVVNKYRNSKSYLVQSYTLKTKRIKRLGEITMPFSYTYQGRKIWNRSTPKLYSFATSPYIMYKKSAGEYKVINIVTGRSFTGRAPDATSLLGFMPTTVSVYSHEQAAFSPYLIFRKNNSGNNTRLLVVRVFDFKVVMRHSYRGNPIKKAVYIPSHSFKTLKLSKQISDTKVDHSDRDNRNDNNRNNQIDREDDDGREE